MDLLRLVESRKAERFESVKCSMHTLLLYHREVPYTRVTSTVKLTVSDGLLPFLNVLKN